MLIDLGDAIPEIPIDLLGQPVAEEDANVQWPSDLNEKVAELESYIDKAIELLRLVESRDRNELDVDFERLDEVRPARVEYLKELSASIERGDLLSDIEPQILEANSIPTGAELRKLLEELVKRLDGYGIKLEQIKQDIQGFADKRGTFKDDKELRQFLRGNLLETIPEQLTNFSNTLLEISLLQAEARANSVELPEVQLKSDTAFDIARCFRRDLMNARASLVDQWRQIEVFADQLESQFDLVLEGDMGNVGGNPFKLRYENGSLRGGFRFDAPIVRLAERNNYRAALINYQQARRDFYQFEDELSRDLRLILRNVDLNKVLFEVNRKQIQIRIEEVELARFRLEEPARPGATRSSLGATTANDLTRALDGLQRAQSAFLNSWVNYEVARRSLDFDLGTMQVDEAGNWIDPITIDASIAERAASMMGITLECACAGIVISPEFQTDEFLAPGEPGTEPSSRVEGSIDPIPNGQNSLPYEPPGTDPQPPIEKPAAARFERSFVFRTGRRSVHGASVSTATSFAEPGSTAFFKTNGNGRDDTRSSRSAWMLVFQPIPKNSPISLKANFDDTTTSRASQIRILPTTESAALHSEPATSISPNHISASKAFFGPLDRLDRASQSAAAAVTTIAVDPGDVQNATPVVQASNWTELPVQGASELMERPK